MSLNATASQKAALNAIAATAQFSDVDRTDYERFTETTNEKPETVNAILREIEKREAPVARIFDAGIGNGYVLAGVLERLPRTDQPLYIGFKEFSASDVVASLHRLSGQLAERPDTVLVGTNINFTGAPWFRANKKEGIATPGQEYLHIKLRGRTAADFNGQFHQHVKDIQKIWETTVNAKGAVVPAKQAVLVVTHESLNDSSHVIPKRHVESEGRYDLVIGSQPWRAASSAAFKAEKIITPLAHSLAPGGQAVFIQSTDGNTAHEIVRRVWPAANPFPVNGEALAQATRAQLSGLADQFRISNDRTFGFNMAGLDSQLPVDLRNLRDAFRNSAYFCQIPGADVEAAIESRHGLHVTEQVIGEHGRLDFTNELIVIERAGPAHNL